MEEIRKFIEEHVKKVKKLHKDAHFAYWDAAISGKKEDYDRYEKLQLEIEKIYHNKEDFGKVKEWSSQDIKDNC